MSLILNIDTATENAIISIADDGIVLQSLKNNIQKDHASFLHIAIKQLLSSCHIKLKDIDAIAVVNGPGSYTGIRVGMASAKGLCFALSKPLITIDTLTVMADTALESNINKYMLCPLLDARRMEVFFALYDYALNTIIPPRAAELQPDFLKEFLNTGEILFFGNAATKWQQICGHPNAYFENINITPSSMSKLSYRNFTSDKFDNLSYSDPLYLKEFYHPLKK
jgi:tRNA threonylcarbamoyladenosine biosynthesis protein TsaB